MPPRADAGRETPVVFVETQPHPEVVSHRLPGVDPGRVGRVEPLSDFLRIEPVDIDVLRIVAIIHRGDDDDVHVIKRFPFRSLLQRLESEPPVLRGAYRDALVPSDFLKLPDIGPASARHPLGRESCIPQCARRRAHRPHAQLLGLRRMVIWADASVHGHEGSRKSVSSR